MPNQNPRLKIRKRVFPGKPLSDVSIPEVSIGGSQHLTTVPYPIKGLRDVTKHCSNL